MQTRYDADNKRESTPLADQPWELAAELVLVALGFAGTDALPLVEDLDLALDNRGNVARDDNWRASAPGVYVAGDMGRGASLIVWAIAEGRAVAASIDRDLMGSTDLPAPVTPSVRTLGGRLS